MTASNVIFSEEHRLPVPIEFIYMGDGSHAVASYVRYRYDTELGFVDATLFEDETHKNTMLRVNHVVPAPSTWFLEQVEYFAHQ